MCRHFEKCAKCQVRVHMFQMLQKQKRKQKFQSCKAYVGVWDLAERREVISGKTHSVNQQSSRNWHEAAWTQDKAQAANKGRKKCESLHSEPLASCPRLALIALITGLFPITSSTPEGSGRLPSRESDQPQRRNFRQFNQGGLPKRVWDPIQLSFRKYHQNNPRPLRASNQYLSKWSCGFSPVVCYSRTLLTNRCLTDQYSPSLRKNSWKMLVVYCLLMANRLLSNIITYFCCYKLSYLLVFCPQIAFCHLCLLV